MSKGFVRALLESKELKAVTKAVEQRQNQLVYGVSGSQITYLTTGIYSAHPKVILFVTPSEANFSRIISDFKTFMPNQEVLTFPNLEVLPYEMLASSKEILIERAKVFSSLLKGEPQIILTTFEALANPIMPKEIYQKGFITFKVGDLVDISDLAKKLSNLGYERVELVEAPGQFAIRGGIVDIGTLTGDGFRLEFFDEEVDSIRSFDLDSQRSVDKIMELVIGPSEEVIVNEQRLIEGAVRLKKDFQSYVGRLKKPGKETVLENLNQKFLRIIEFLEQGFLPPKADELMPFLFPERYCLLDYLGEGSIVCLEEPQRINEVSSEKWEEARLKGGDWLEKGFILPRQLEYQLSLEELWAKLKHFQTCGFSLLPKEFPYWSYKKVVSIAGKSIPPFLGQIDVFLEELRRWKKLKYAIVLIAETSKQCERLLALLKEKKIEAIYVSKVDQEIIQGNIVITEGSIHGGFDFQTGRLVFLTERDIFGQGKKARKRLKSPEGSKISSFVDLKVGNYVVHVNHGIGKYLGVKTLEVGGLHKDYLEIHYAGEDKLYVPTDQINLIQKYLGSDDHKPRVNKLGGTDWAKTKNKVKESVKDMAEDLIKLYAEREKLQGYPFGTDTVWQKDFEEAFPFEETPDQLRSTTEIKKDMEKARPMDRLLCGDVGYGKTEVAIRAAFKAVMDGKQVAVLVPTTILAQQHYNTFKERCGDYGISVEILSRFRKPAEQKKTLEALKAGLVDIVIGTHRLVQEDVKFKDLGLLIVDEEQRFGVAHKERLKQLKTNIDVLTLSATPIPRTLHMSMIGVRDMSLLENPPQERLPVQTFVVEFNGFLVAEAIRRELSRGGQVYFVHNRVQDIEQVATHVQTLVPEARIGIGHGQMREEQLEEVIMEFLDGQIDVLVCTTIIETGLDISNVNTIVIDEADKMGLAQLYQLRGRVGRTNRLAYAYLTYRKDKVLSEVAEKRLQAIREFTEFGSGFKIAMRDLEIRGTGNLLGAEQSGHIMSVGFDMYCRLLEEAVQELRGEPVRTPVEPSIEINIDAYIPEGYITDQGAKMEAYRKIVLARDIEQLEDIQEEFVDRFGDLPHPVTNLFVVARIKVLAKQLGIKAILQRAKKIIFTFEGGTTDLGPNLIDLAQRRRGISFVSSPEFQMKLNLGPVSEKKPTQEIEQLLTVLKKDGIS